jgi:hypothetical protein
LGDLLEDQVEATGGVEAFGADKIGVLAQEQLDVGQLLPKAVGGGIVGGVERVDQGGEPVGVEAGPLELDEGGVELVGQARAVGRLAVVGQPLAVQAEQVADHHAATRGGDLGHADVAAAVEHRLAELAEVDHLGAGERAEGDGQQPLGLEGGLLGDEPVDGRAERVLLAQGSDPVDEVVRLAGAGAAEDEADCAHRRSPG